MMSFIDDDRNRFDAAFGKIVEDIISNEQHDQKIHDAVVKLREVLEYNVPGGKRNRGLSVIGSIRHLMNEEDITEEVLDTAVLLGWCVEWFQAFFLIADDIMDQSLTRRGQPCWYKKPDVGLVAVNDCIMMEQTVFLLLKKHIRHQSYYLNVIELFHEVAYLTSLGQSMDLITKPGHDFENFTIERYKTIVKYKTAFYSFYLPVALAFYMAGITDKETHENAKKILLEMGEFFQVQDDFLDAFGDPMVTGKVGTDIEENKCTWLIVKALETASQQQLVIIKENYGVNNKEASFKVKEVYKELALDKIFQNYEDSSHERIIKLIVEKPLKIPPAVFLEFVEKIYKRKK